MILVSFQVYILMHILKCAIILEKINNSSYAQIIKLELSANKQSIQKPDSASTILTHIIRSLQRLPKKDWNETINAVTSSYANTRPVIRCVVESKMKVKLLVQLFEYQYFEESAAIISPGFFKKLYRVTSSVCYQLFNDSAADFNFLACYSFI
jgi:hypothetical protein